FPTDNATNQNAGALSDSVEMESVLASLPRRYLTGTADQAAGDSAERRHQHGSDHGQAEHRRRARQGLVRGEGGRRVDLPSRERQVPFGRPLSDGGLAA